MSTVHAGACDFDSWRAIARSLLENNVSPDRVLWTDAAAPSTGALPGVAVTATGSVTCETRRVPRAFLALAERVSCLRDEARWSVLYRVLHRLAHGEPELLAIATDPDVRWLANADHAVRRDIHKMHAFVRFRRVDGEGGIPHYIAWHRPRHRVERLAAPFFVDRFASMRWSILTPELSLHWDGATLRESPGVPRRDSPADDALEALWREYYRSIFNPARANLRATLAEMPAHHWPTMPETQVITELLREGPARLEAFARTARPTAEPLVPKGAGLAALREAARGCDACALHCDATQTVFGAGNPQAVLMFVGEQPGDEEDLEGMPFIGPAGRVFDEALGELRIDRAETYLTNTVKHFRFHREGKRRIHDRPRAENVAACKPWLIEEIVTVSPAVVVCLGNTAARALLGPAYRGDRDRGRLYLREDAPTLIATFHPAALLRCDAAARDAMRREWLEHLATARDHAAARRP